MTASLTPALMSHEPGWVSGDTRSSQKPKQQPGTCFQPHYQQARLAGDGRQEDGQFWQWGLWGGGGERDRLYLGSEGVSKDESVRHLQLSRVSSALHLAKPVPSVSALNTHETVWVVPVFT